MRPAHSFLDLDGETAEPPYILKYETLAVDFDKMAVDVGLPDRGGALPHVNRGTVSNVVRSKVLSDKQLRRSVGLIFARDMKVFGYET